MNRSPQFRKFYTRFLQVFYPQKDYYTHKYTEYNPYEPQPYHIRRYRVRRYSEHYRTGNMRVQVLCFHRDIDERAYTVE